MTGQILIGCRTRLTPWRWLLLVVLAAEVLWLLCPPPSGVVERWYSQGFYRAVSAVIVPVQNIMPVPLMSIVALVAAIAAALVWRRQWRRLRGAGQSRWRMLPWSLWLAAQVAIPLVFWMLVVWGAGYQRTPVGERWALDSTSFTPDESARLQQQLLSIIHETVAGAAGESREAAVRDIAAAMKRVLAARGDRAVSVPNQVRATPPGFFLTFSTGGMCMPAAIEPFADGAYDPVSFVQVAAHELAHVAGYNRESEATLVGYMAGLASDNDLARYAVALDIYEDLIARIRDKEAYAAAWEALPEKAREDIETGNDIVKRYMIRIRFFQRVGYHVYDTYLKSQGIDEGMANYSAGLRLFAGVWRKGLAAMDTRTAGQTELEHWI